MKPAEGQRQRSPFTLRATIGRLLRPPSPPSVFQRCLRSGRATIGQGSYGEPQVHIFYGDNSTRLRIGAYCSIGSDVRVILGGEHRTDWVTTSPLRILHGLPRAGTDGHPHSKGDVTIANDVWIGTGATILSGVTIGNGAVIGAASVVTRDVPPYAIVAGNPAGIVRYRFTPEICRALERIAWWNWPPEEVLAAADQLCSPDVATFIRNHDPNSNTNQAGA
jgi:acetyltransferase-like isoleucine patch superfamily enzyme